MLPNVSCQAMTLRDSQLFVAIGHDKDGRTKFRDIEPTLYRGQAGAEDLWIRFQFHKPLLEYLADARIVLGVGALGRKDRRNLLKSGHRPRAIDKDAAHDRRRPLARLKNIDMRRRVIQ